MFQGLYSIVDTVAEEFGPIFHAKNDGVAIRNYRNFLKDNPTVNPLEVELVKVGEFNTAADSGEIFPGVKTIERSVNTELDPDE